MSFLRIASASLAAWLLTPAAHALEPRTWIVLDGRIIDGTLQKVSGSLVQILDKDGRAQQLDKSFLSIGDNEYIRENFPDVKQGFSATAAVVMPQPAKMAKIDQKTFKMAAGTFVLPVTGFDIMETPHFKIMYVKPIDPRDVGELAERLWFDAAYVHEKFPGKFTKDVKMAVFLAPDDSIYDGIGRWYVELLDKAGQKEPAAKMAATWPLSGAATMNLTTDICQKYGVMDHARVFRAYRKGSTSTSKNEMIRGVWTPFFVHCLAADLIDIQAPGTSGFGAKGYFALTTGHAYYKEVFLTGKSETGLLRAQSATGKDASTARGLDDARQWATELKKAVRKGEVKATWESINLLTREGTDPKGLLLAYGWGRYLQASLPKLNNFNKLVQSVATWRQMPDPDDFAKIYGFGSGAEMEADFQKWLASGEFR